MILEVVTWDIKPNLEKEFEFAFGEAQQILASMNGYKSHQFQKSLENPSRYILLVNWDTLEDHTEGFQKSDLYQKYRSILKKFYEPGAKLEHFKMVSENAL